MNREQITTSNRISEFRREIGRPVGSCLLCVADSVVHAAHKEISASGQLCEQVARGPDPAGRGERGELASRLARGGPSALRRRAGASRRGPEERGLRDGDTSDTMYRGVSLYRCIAMYRDVSDVSDVSR